MRGDWLQILRRRVVVGLMVRILRLGGSRAQARFWGRGRTNLPSRELFGLSMRSGGITMLGWEAEMIIRKGIDAMIGESHMMLLSI